MGHSGYRIIDANSNRAREALRVIEDYCRFALNCASLSGRAKDLRHRLCTIIAGLGDNRLLTSDCDHLPLLVSMVRICILFLISYYLLMRFCGSKLEGLWKLENFTTPLLNL